MLLNQCVSAEGELPTCQDTGTAICIGHKGEDVYTGADDAECISRGVYETYKDRNLRYSQVVPFTMTDEKIRAQTCPRRSTSTAVIRAWSTSFCSLPRAAARPKQDLPLSADQSPSERGVAHEVHPRAHYRSGYVGMSALPPCDLHRRHVGRDVSVDRQEGLGRISRRAAHLGQRGRPLLPRSGMGGQGTEDMPGDRSGRTVRRQYYVHDVRDTRSAPCRIVPRGYRRQLLGRP